ncbi:spore coat protein YsxE [Bacillus sp. CGMCC 1.16541]|uniref:spore coat protein YsxE n=1 Tax=Bacillus sp. CGMCC 1.16541 TaxID=2185143 RepID=UPI000D7357FF|nr:spore coat protein YsxE [Bacillus sp. CGMCC 1.16541]
MNNDQLTYGPLLEQYRLQVDFIEDYGKVKKVYTNQGVFALKRVDDRSLSHNHFIQKVQHLHQKGFMKFVPIYQTTEGAYTVPYRNAYYYLMPWLPDNPTEERDIRYHKLFQELAQLHALSAHEVDVVGEDIEAHYEALKKTWEDRQAELEQYVVESEKKVYMSPFELYFCTFYYETTRALEYAQEKLKQWYEYTKEKEKIRVTTVHGKLSAKHFVYDERGNGYFINFEQAREASPIYDLVSFYYRTLKTYPMTTMDSYEWYSTYEQHFPLREEERLLLHMYLAFPEPIYQAVVQYRQNYRSKRELDHTKSLLSAFWLTKNLEQLNLKIDAVDQQRKQAAEAAAQQSQT